MQTERESTRRLRTDAHLYDRPDRAHRDMVHFDAPSASRHVGARVLAWFLVVRLARCCVCCVVSQCRFYSWLTSFWLRFLYSARCVARVQRRLARSAHLSDLLPCVLLLARSARVERDTRAAPVREFRRPRTDRGGARRSREAFRDSWRGRTWAKAYLLRLFAHLTPPRSRGVAHLAHLHTWAGRLI